jgi:hypothetical protein
MMPAHAWRVLGAWGSVGAVTRGPALVLRDGEGATVNADRRGRVTLPAWLRSACGPGDAAVIVAVRRPPVGDVAATARRSSRHGGSAPPTSDGRDPGAGRRLHLR